MNKKALLIIFLTFISLRMFPQLIDNKVNLYLSHWGGTFSGIETVKDGSFESPSLYSNFTAAKQFSVKMLVKTSRFCSLGISLGKLDASGWKYTNSSLYNKSGIDLYSFSPVIQFHSGFAETGIMNRFGVCAEIAPSVGMSKLSLAKPIFEINNQSGLVTPPVESRDIFLGVSSNIGVEVSVTRMFGISASYAFSYNMVKSDLYSDKHFSYSGFELGLIVRLKKDKLFY